MGEDMITILIKIAASLVLGVLAGFGAVYIFNKMPAARLTDYDAKPPAEHRSSYPEGQGLSLEMDLCGGIQLPFDPAVVF